MSRNPQSIIEVFTKITEDSIESGNGLDQIDDLCDEVEELDDPSQVFPAFFALMERFPCADLGSPGALVHTMEQHVGSYEDLLEESIKRCPTYLSVWMVNRILNAPSSDSERWLPILQSVLTHPTATAGIISEVRSFLEHQST